MRKVVLDFYFTILLPTALFLTFVLSAFIQAYFSARSDSRKGWKRLKDEAFQTLEEGKTFLEWTRRRTQEKRDAWKQMKLPLFMLGLVGAAFLLSSDLKTFFAWEIWNVLIYAGFILFVVGGLLARHYAKESQWWKVLACFVVMLLIAAGTEHCFHQSINSGRAWCSGCGD